MACLNVGCSKRGGVFTARPGGMLKKVLPAKMFQRFSQQQISVELQKAGLANLVECPYCWYACIMEDPRDQGVNRVLECKNPECLKVRMEERNEGKYIEIFFSLGSE